MYTCMDSFKDIMSCGVLMLLPRIISFPYVMLGTCIKMEKNLVLTLLIQHNSLYSQKSEA